MEVKSFNISKSNLPYLFEKIKALDLSLGYVANVTLKSHKRTLSQNDWVRKFARDFGNHFGYEADFAYDMLMFKFNPIFKTDPDGNEIRIGGSFSKLNTTEAALVQENMLKYGIKHGFFWENVL